MILENRRTTELEGQMSVAQTPSGRWVLMAFLREWSGVNESLNAPLVIYFTNKIHMNETVSKVQGRAETQRNLIKLEKWADRNLMKSNEGKSSVLPLGRNSQRHQYSLRANQLKSCLAEKLLGRVLMENHEPAVCWKPTTYQAAGGRAMPSSWVRECFPSRQDWWDTSGVLGPGLGFPVQGRKRHPGGTSVKIHPEGGTLDTWCMRKKLACSAWKKGVQRRFHCKLPLAKCEV